MTVNQKKIMDAAGSTRRRRGFTLLELMITVVIISILAAIAYPSYLSQVRKSYRAEAQADLMELASFMERYFTENNAYHQDSGGNAVTLPFAQSPRTGTARYQITFSTAATATAYTLQAAAQTTGGQNLDPCGNMTIDQTGAKTNSGSATNCW